MLMCIQCSWLCECMGGALAVPIQTTSTERKGEGTLRVLVKFLHGLNGSDVFTDFEGRTKT